MKKHGRSHGISLKKGFGQHFLRDDVVAQKIVSAVQLDNTSSVVEIGCGDGALTRIISQCPFARAWIFEIDPEWSEYVRKKISNARITIFTQDILKTDFSLFEPYKPWTVFSNLPYKITFPVLYILRQNRHLFSQGVLMMQEEVAQKLVATHGRSYGYSSLFFQHYFTFQLLDKISPSAFYPPPKVFSRLVLFHPKSSVYEIPQEGLFWDFVKICFKQPRRTLKNNLVQTHYNFENIDNDRLLMRAQQMTIDDLLDIWSRVSVL